MKFKKKIIIKNPVIFTSKIMDTITKVQTNLNPALENILTSP